MAIQIKLVVYKCTIIIVAVLDLLGIGRIQRASAGAIMTQIRSACGVCCLICNSRGTDELFIILRASKLCGFAINFTWASFNSRRQHIDSLSYSYVRLAIYWSWNDGAPMHVLGTLHKLKVCCTFLCTSTSCWSIDNESIIQIIIDQ